MFCENCGKRVPDGSAFCENCGAKLAQPAVAVATAPSGSRKALTRLTEKAKAIHKKNKWIFPVSGAVILVIIALIVLFSILGKQVSMQDYLNVKLEGYEGYSYMQYEFGDVSFGMRAVGDKDAKKFGDHDEKDDFSSFGSKDVPKKYRDNLEKAQELVASIEVECQLPEGKSRYNLTNGDEILFTITVNEKLAEDLGLTIRDTTFTYVVEGLQKPATFDVLSYFDVKAEGFDGCGEIDLVCNFTGTKQVGDLTFIMQEGERYIRYKDQDGGESYIWAELQGRATSRSNGDEVTGLVLLGADYLIEDGIELVGMEKTYTVSGLTEIQKVDLLAYYSVKFTGLNGSGVAELVPNQEELQVGDAVLDLQTGRWYLNEQYVCSSRVQLNITRGLSNGDEIVMTVSHDEAYIHQKVGVVFTATEKSVTVSNLATYIAQLDDFQNIPALEEFAKEEVRNYLERQWAYAVHGSFGTYSDQTIGEDMNVYKMALVTPKSSSFSVKNNTLWMIVSVTLSDNEITTPTVYYFPVKINDPAVYGDGTPYFSGTVNRGYTDYNTLYDKLIDADNVTIEISE